MTPPLFVDRLPPRWPQEGPWDLQESSTRSPRAPQKSHERPTPLKNPTGIIVFAFPPFSLQMALRNLKRVPRGTFEGPDGGTEKKTSLSFDRWPPRWPQRASKSAKTAPREPREASRWLQDGPRGPQDGPKSAQERPKRAPRGPQEAVLGAPQGQGF